MIPVYIVDRERGEDELSREQILAERMGLPPGEHGRVSPMQSLGGFAEQLTGEAVCIVFDREFWYGAGSWEAWIEALEAAGTEGAVNVPLGSQDPGWRKGLDVPVYLTVMGLERAQNHRAPARWRMQGASLPESFCVVVVPVRLLRLLPRDLKLGELPDFWAARSEPVRVFCSGWLHSFSALGNAAERRDLLGMIDWRGAVLELGCGRGSMARACKESGNSVFWVGIDRHGASLREGQPWLDMAVEADIAEGLPLDGSLRFDRIVCADVLEHLPYPWETLKALRERIKPGGALVAAVPNVGHWSTVQDLLAGRWDEAPSGLFCVTHLRFGTKRSWGRWFDEAGWTVERWEREIVPLPAAWRSREVETGGEWDEESLETVRYRIVAR